MIRLLRMLGGRGRITSSNPVLRSEEIGVDPDAGVMKVGDGATPWNGLPAFGGDIDGGTP